MLPRKLNLLQAVIDGDCSSMFTSSMKWIHSQIGETIWEELVPISDVSLGCETTEKALSGEVLTDYCVLSNSLIHFR